MSRVKKAVNALKHRRSVLKAAKGMRFGRSKKERMAIDALQHAGAYSFAHRRDKKGDMRRLFNVKINAGLRPLGFSYSKFIGAAKKKGIEVDRKILAHLAEFKPETFARVVAKVK
jgi:large subunit ribosomal protein L20